MAIQWYFERDGKQFGPYLAARLQELAAGGEVRPQDLVWKEGMDKGVLASRVARLFATTAVGLTPTESSAAVAEAAPPGAEPALIKEETPPAPAEAFKVRPEERAPTKEAPPPAPVRKRRVLSVKGGVIVSQDGNVLRYRKTCIKCGHGDNSITTAPIPCGTMRASFFCCKCRKNNPVEIMGIS